MPTENEEIFISEDTKLAIKRGVYWLDTNHPGWEQKIDLSNLTMSNCDRCVIGQAVGDYYDTVYNALVDEEIVINEYQGNWPVDHGFNVAIPWNSNNGSNYAALEAGWTEVVMERLREK